MLGCILEKQKLNILSLKHFFIACVCVNKDHRQTYIYTINYRYIICILYTHINIILSTVIIYNYGGCSKLWFLKTALSPSFCEHFAPFRAPAESGQGSVIMFWGVNFVLKVYMRIALETSIIINSTATRKWKHSPKSSYRLPENGNTSWKDFEGFFHFRQTRPFWAKVGSWQTRLLPTFREPSGDFSPTKTSFQTHVSWEAGVSVPLLKPIPWISLTTDSCS